MEKKLYAEPVIRILALGLEESMLASAAGTGGNLVLTGDYNGEDFDDLFD